MTITGISDAIALFVSVEDLPQKELDDHRRLCDPTSAVDDEVPVLVVANCASRHQVMESILAELPLYSPKAN